MKIKLYISTGFAGCRHEDECEIDDEEWESMDQEERDDLLEELALAFLNDHIDYGAYPKGEE